VTGNVVTATSSASIAKNSTETVTATCTGGGILLGGGFSTSDLGFNANLLESAPTTAGADGVWTVEVENTGTSSISPTVTAYVVCSK
jgi:hypothetical protein